MNKLSRQDRFSRWASRALAVAGCAVAVTLVYADCRIAASAGASAQETVVGEFTGQFDSGTPVYRLPPITVSASRNEAVADARAQKRDAREPRSRGRAPS